jgi:Mrp family chromosome partitioning ATPase
MGNCSQPNDNQSCSCDSPHQHDQQALKEEQQIQAALQAIRHKLVVMSGKGGVGKSSVSVSLALQLAQRGLRVGLMDADLHGPDILRMLGLKEPVDFATGQFLSPGGTLENLKIMSIEALMQDRDSAVIWRGPLKHSIIKQFLTEIKWGQLDYLVIDVPPGTGDEPLSIAQIIPDAQAVIVTTPQEISLADVRKSINFCHAVKMTILGLVENMSSLVCPECHKPIPLFQSGGGERTAKKMGLTLLGELPFDHQVVEAADTGKMTSLIGTQSPFFQAMNTVVDNILATR